MKNHGIHTSLRTVMGPIAAACLLSACSLGTPPKQLALAAPPQWYAPLPSTGTATSTSNGLPHQGSLAQLSQWWQQQNDPLLVELINAAEAVSPNVFTARSNIEQARLQSIIARAALLPSLDATASFTRSRAAPFAGITSPPTNTAQLGLQTNWEADIFGGNTATRNASDERLLGAQAQWHDARVSVAAETANQYYTLRACQKLLEVSRSDEKSRAETARLSTLATRAGFEAPATSALAQASAADSRNRTSQQEAQCEVNIKALVALTALSEPDLRQKLAAAPADTPQQPLPVVTSVPADVLTQRPDVFNAARELAAASDEVGAARAARYPRLTLAGSITSGKSRAAGFNQSFDTWSFGPIALTVPVLDGGGGKANVDASIARYDDAATKYRSTARQAVREVEEALVNLQSTGERTTSAAAAAEGYRASFAGTEARYKAGLASLVELEDSRRTLLSSQSAVVSLERERRSAWIALYRALGGGWNSDIATPPYTSSTSYSSSATQP